MSPNMILNNSSNNHRRHPPPLPRITREKAAEGEAPAEMTEPQLQ